MKRGSIKVISVLLFFVCTFLAQGQEPVPEKKTQPKPAIKDLIVKAVVNNSEVVGDEFTKLELAILILQNGKVDWENFKNPQNFLPFKVGQIVIQERGVPIDPRLKDYNLFVLVIPLSLPDQSYGQYKIQKLPIEYSVLSFVEGEQDVKGRLIKKKIYVRLLPVSKVPLRAYLEADRKSLEIGDQYNLDLNIIFDSKTSLLNLKFQESTDQKKESFLDNSFFADHEVVSLRIVESREGVDRHRAKVMYRLTSFVAPPKLLKVGPLNVIHRVDNEENARIYKTPELNIQLNSVLTKYSVFEGIRPVYFEDWRQRFWLVVVPRYVAEIILSGLILFILFRLVAFLYSLRFRYETKNVLAIQRIMNAQRRIPLFLWHWLCLGLLILIRPTSKKHVPRWTKHIKMCAGSVFGLSVRRSQAFTAGELTLIDPVIGTLLSNLEITLLTKCPDIKLPTRKSLLKKYAVMPLQKIVYGAMRRAAVLSSKLKGLGRRILARKSE